MYVKNIASLTVVPTEQWSNQMLNLTTTKSPGGGFESLGTDSMRMIPYLGMTFYFFLFFITTYVFYAIVTVMSKKIDGLIDTKRWLKLRLVY